MCAITPPGDSQHGIIRFKTASYEKERSRGVIQTKGLICNISSTALIQYILHSAFIWLDLWIAFQPKTCVKRSIVPILPTEYILYDSRSYVHPTGGC